MKSISILFKISNLKVILFIYVVLTFGTICLSKTYYVSTKKGTDFNNGSKDAPFKTIQFGIEKLKEGDTLYLEEGRYFINYPIKLKSGIHILAKKNEIVEIHGTELKNNWIQVSNNLWKCNQQDSILQLFIENKPFFQAAYPTINEGMKALQMGTFAVAFPNKQLYIEGLTQLKDSRNLNILGIHGKRLVGLNGKVINQTNNTLNIENNAWYWDTTARIRKEYLDTGQAFIFGSKDFLDTDNEWYWENGELFLQSNSNPNNSIIEVRTNKMILDLSNSSNCSLTNVNFFAANINLKNSRNCVVNNCKFFYPTPFFTFRQGFEKFSPNSSKGYEDPENWNGNGPDWNKYDGPETWNGNGIEISGENNTIENCYIAHSWGDGLTVWGKGNQIKNNIITDCNWMGIDCAPLNISGTEHLIQNNELSYGGRSILIHRFLSNSKILNNHIHHGGIICNDQGLTYTFWTDGKGTEIAYNYLHDNLGKTNHCGIYLDNWTYNFNIHHNIINNSGTAININKPHNNHTIFNNTFYNNTYSMGAWGPEGTTIRNVKTFNNITNTNKKERWNYDSFYGTEMDSNHVYFENNIFIDPENHNFSLKKYSYPIDKGITNEYTLPFKGKAPDLGAMESDSEPIEYGSSIIIENEQHYPPKAPLKLKLTNNTPTATVLAWEYPFNYIDSFYLERKISGDTFKIIAKLPALTLNYNDSNQPPGEYRYRVKALNKYGISDPSNSVEIFNPKFENSLFLDAENNDRNNGTNKSGDVIINNDNNDWICYKQVDYGTRNLDACIVNMAVPCEQAWQEIQLRIDRPMGRMIGNLTTTSTGGWDKFEQRTFSIEKISGKHDTYIKFKGNQGLGTIDWFNLYNSQGNVQKKYPTDPICPQQRNTSRLIPVTIYPNPSSEELAVAIENLETSDINIKFASTEGILLLDKTETKQQPGTQEYYLHNHINIPSLTKGIYHLQITITGKRITQTKNYKFIKN